MAPKIFMKFCMQTVSIAINRFSKDTLLENLPKTKHRAKLGHLSTTIKGDLQNTLKCLNVYLKV